MTTKGATRFDKLCHAVFDAKSGCEYKPSGVNLLCDNCGEELKAYYCEEQLYLVDCERCGRPKTPEAWAELEKRMEGLMA